MTPEELDKWRWEIACTIIPEAPVLSGFDPRKPAVELANFAKIVQEYRRLVIADEKPAKLGKVE